MSLKQKKKDLSCFAIDWLFMGAISQRKKQNKWTNKQKQKKKKKLFEGEKE